MWSDPRMAAALLLMLVAGGVLGLKDVQVSVPEAVAAGDTVSLHCRYDLEQDLLYSVKWYRGRQEFFRYIPKELPHTKVFPLPGVDVDVGRSGPSGVVLRSVSPPISGRYRCEVSADAPSFHTSMKTSYMHVVELPDSAPVITAEKARVSVGDTLRVRCTAPPAYPPANLTWLLNNMPVKGTPTDLDPPAQQKPTKRPATSSEQSFLPTNRNTTRLFGQVNSGHGNDPEVGNFGYVLRGQRNTDAVSMISKNREETEYSQRNIDDMFPKKNVEEKFYNHRDTVEVPGMRKIDPVRGDLVKRSSGSSLVLAIRQDSFQQGRLTLSCRASVFSLYNAQAHLILEGESPQIASVLGTRESSSGAAPGGGGGGARKVLCLSLLLVVLQR